MAGLVAREPDRGAQTSSKDTWVGGGRRQEDRVEYWMKEVLVHRKAKEGIPEGSRGRRSSGKGPGPARRGDTAALSGRRGHMERGRQASGGRSCG